MASPAETILAVQIYNAMPPVSEDKFDIAVLATARNGDGILFVGKDDGICQQMGIPAAQWVIFLRRVRGSVS